MNWGKMTSAEHVVWPDQKGLSFPQRREPMRRVLEKERMMDFRLRGNDMLLWDFSF